MDQLITACIIAILVLEVALTVLKHLEHKQ